MRISRAQVVMALLLGWLAVDLAQAGTATSITGLYTTGSSYDSAYPFVDSHWKVTNSTSGNAYVVLWGTPGAWASSTSAKWISALPSATGGFYGQSTTVSYNYALTFQVAGSGSGSVNNVAITLTLYVDDSATIYVNGTQVAVVSGSNLYSTSTTLTLSSGFVVGSNTISISVNNAGGASGLMVSSISGAIVPEVGAWVPLAAALVLFGWFRLRPKRKLRLAA